MSGQAPLTVTHTVEVDVAAAGVDTYGALVEAPFAGTVTGVAVEAAALLTGVVTNSRTLQLVNKGQAGAGSTVVASLAFVNAVNAAADVDTQLTLSVVAGATTVVAGDVLELQSLHVGTGLAAPRFQGRITFARA